VSVAKVAVTIQSGLLKRLDRLVRKSVYPSRSRIIQEAVEEKLARLERSRLARECSKLDPKEERKLADLGLSTEASEWPDY
jgi:metal-responsive CopG/Arc/MetJ family transcriptional regulator